ncbi:sensor histidine kinase [Arcticibacter sp.]|uniref:sensor histidine kinase n=1 Tax=Arcticibacter sp. TaxID=1872630 RepID=UPI00388F7BBF
MQNTDKISTLIELNEELENYFRNTIIPQLFVDSHLVLRKFTPPAMRQFSLKPTDVGRHIEDIKDNFRFPTILENIQHVIDSGEVLEKEIQTTDHRWYQMNILPYIVQKNKKTDGVIITFVEITMRIRDLKEQEKLIAEHEILLDTISHDIKTPLTSLGLTIEMLKQIPEKGMARFPFLLEKIENSLVKIQHIINDLTDSRQQEHRYKAVEELLDFEHILEDVRLTLATQLKESHAIITAEINHSEILFIRRKLRSVVYNLVNNAIKYRSEDRTPEILVRTYRENDDMVITVSDNGMGIPQSEFKNIFQKYQRVSPSGEGSGIGLYLVNEIIKASGGKISVSSDLGKGSEFKVYLKIAAS